MPAVSKAQQFATKAESIDGWVVERKKVGDSRRVRASRGGEAFIFSWVRVESGRDNFEHGVHKIGEHKEPISNVREALRLMSLPPGVVKVVEKRERAAKPTSEGKPTKAPTMRTVRLPFDPQESSDAQILAAVTGCWVAWLTDFIAEEAQSFVLPHTKILPYLSPPKDNVNNPELRTLNFISPEGFRAVRINTIVGVK
jgi:hypothetical protein